MKTTSTARPINLKPWEVLALNAGRLTQLRRVVKPQPISQGMMSFGEAWEWNRGKEPWFAGVTEEQMRHPGYGLAYFCPFGKPGTRLFGRETWCGVGKAGTDELDWNEDGNTYRVAYRADGGYIQALDDDGAIKYRADGREASPWQSPVTMPQWASRFSLELTGVRVERAQEIDEMSCYNCGIDERIKGYNDAEHYMIGGSPIEGGSPAKFAYIGQWKADNGPGSWEANPFVWVVDVKRL